MHVKWDDGELDLIFPIKFWNRLVNLKAGLSDLSITSDSKLNNLKMLIPIIGKSASDEVTNAT